MKKILTIAASDSSGGAGIQADIKAITVLGGHALSAITALTAQNSISIEDIYPVPCDFLSKQLDAVLKDIGADAVKTGMLLEETAVKTIVDKIKEYNIPIIVIDPVISSTTGHTLLKDDALKALKEELLPMATMITPNLDEAFALTGIKADSISSMKDAAEKLFELGAKNVLIKGGHLKDDPTDILYDGKSFFEFSETRINTKNTHGTGCTLSAAIATELAKGSTPFDAVKNAKEFITTAIKYSLPFGSGHGPTNPFAAILQNAEIYQCIKELKRNIEVLKNKKIGRLIPEIQSNFGYITPAGTGPEDVIAFPGRIIRLKDSITTVSPPEPGASRHIAKVILTAFKHNRLIRSAMNIAYRTEIIDACRKLGFTIGEFKRSEEPPTVKELEGSTMEWGTEKAINNNGFVPDIIFDQGGIGKEPITRVLGTDPTDVAGKIIKISKIV
jgi:hydroxymethylpyrimidine kinase/phosphomethylpyrimidine kinase